MTSEALLAFAIAPILIFSFFGIILAVVVELIEAWQKLRAADLMLALDGLLHQDDQLLDQFYGHPLIVGLRGGASHGKTPIRETTQSTGWSSWTDKSARTRRASLPSYIPRDIFAAVMIDLHPPALSIFQQLSVDPSRLLVSAEPSRLRAELERWYDGAMDRASGRYKRRTQKRLFWLSVILAISFNLNIVDLGKYLTTEQPVGETSVQTSDAGRPRSLASRAVDQPIGWSADDIIEIAESMRAAPRPWSAVGTIITLAIGYLAAALAIMVAAGFWFDLLNRIMVIRSTVKPSEKSPDARSKDGVSGARSDSGGVRESRSSLTRILVLVLALALLWAFSTLILLRNATQSESPNDRDFGSVPHSLSVIADAAAKGSGSIADLAASSRLRPPGGATSDQERDRKEVSCCCCVEPRPVRPPMDEDYPWRLRYLWPYAAIFLGLSLWFWARDRRFWGNRPVVKPVPAEDSANDPNVPR